MEFPTAGNLKAVRGVGVLHTQTDVRIQFPVQTVPQMTGSNIFSFLTCQRRIIYHKVHCNRRLRNLLERNRIRVFQITQRIPDMNIRNSGNCNDGPNISFCNFHLIQTIKLIQLADLHFFLFIRFMMIHQHHFLIHRNLAVIYFTDADTSNVLIIVNGTDQYLCPCFRIPFRCRNIIQNRLK